MTFWKTRHIQERFRHDFGAKKCQKSTPRGTQNETQKVPLVEWYFYKILMSFWSRFWCLLGPILAPKIVPLGSFFAPGSLLDTYLFQKRRFLWNSRKTNRKSMKMAFRRLPKTTQNRPKRLSRASFFQLRFRLRFLINFGAILPPKMAPSGHPFRDQNRPQHRSKFDLEKRSPQESPKTRQELPREPSRCPKRRPGTPQDAPRAAQGPPNSIFVQ